MHLSACRQIAEKHPEMPLAGVTDTRLARSCVSFARLSTTAGPRNAYGGESYQSDRWARLRDARDNEKSPAGTRGGFGVRKPVRDGLENSTFSPQAFGERLAVGNPSSWFAPTLGMSSFNFYADCGPQATAAMPPYSRHEALIWPLTSPSLRVRLPGFIQRKRAAAAIRDR